MKRYSEKEWKKNMLSVKKSSEFYSIKNAHKFTFKEYLAIYKKEELESWIKVLQFFPENGDAPYSNYSRHTRVEHEKQIKRIKALSYTSFINELKRYKRLKDKGKNASLKYSYTILTNYISALCRAEKTIISEKAMLDFPNTTLLCCKYLGFNPSFGELKQPYLF